MSGTEVSSTVAEVSQKTGVDVIEVGRVMAQLNDWRAITFVLVVVIVVLLMDRFLQQREMRLERKAMMDMANTFASNSGKVAGAMEALRGEVLALRLTTARMESTAAAIAEGTTHAIGHTSGNPR